MDYIHSLYRSRVVTGKISRTRYFFNKDSFLPKMLSSTKSKVICDSDVTRYTINHANVHASSAQDQFDRRVVNLLDSDGSATIDCDFNNSSAPFQQQFGYTEACCNESEQGATAIQG